MAEQIKKQRIDTGQAGDASTGDNLYEGGTKLNQNLDALYNTFGDIRLFDEQEYGVGLQKLHATSYYQKYPIEYYTSGPVEIGTMHDIDTTDNPLTATLPNGKQGEMVVFRDSIGSWDINPLIVAPQQGESINGSSNAVEFENIYSKVIFTCVNDEVGSVEWTYKIEPISGDYSVPVNSTIEVTNVISQTMNLFNKDLYNGVKLMIYSSDLDGNNKSISELLMLVDDDGIITDEYSIIEKGNRPYSVEWTLSGNNVIANIFTTLSRITFTVKVIETIKVES
ncbi:MAG: baseplate wedge tail fiber connector [Acidobacteria bacterium]|nr:baseplate wedge tail fiber connector [Acidobacteriota bacterium]